MREADRTYVGHGGGKPPQDRPSPDAPHRASDRLWVGAGHRRSRRRRLALQQFGRPSWPPRRPWPTGKRSNPPENSRPKRQRLPDHQTGPWPARGISDDIAWLKERHQWPGLEAIGKVIRSRQTEGKTTRETAYYLLSAKLSVERFAEVVRAHWGVENRLHWYLDVVMNEDQARSRMDNAPENLAVLRHMALNIMRKDTSKGSLRVRFNRAAWNNKYLARLLTLA